MSYNNGRITGNAEIRDVQLALSTAETDEGKLCSHVRINKWARYKPERRDGRFLLTYSQRRANHFGLDIPFCTQARMNSLANDLLENNVLGWQYLKPRGDMTGVAGGVEEFYRITDFVRHPNERTQSQNGDPTPVNLQGYNHDAKVPFEAFLASEGIKKLSDSNGVYYEINLQLATQLVITFFNSRGDDLHLQDLIDFNDNSGDIAWRPVIQVFYDYYDDNARLVHWYDTTQSNKYIEVAGGAITNDQYAEWKVTLDLNTSFFNQYKNQNMFFHMCIGVGCCNQANTLVWKSANGPLFLMPFTEEQQNNDPELPFYYRFKIVDYFARRIRFSSLLYGSNNTASFEGSSVTIPANANGTIVLSMTITKDRTQKLHFVDEHSMTVAEGYSSLRICLEDVETHVLYYLTPTTGPSSRTRKTDAYVNTSTDTTATQALYGMTTEIDVNSIPNGGYGRYQVKAYIGVTEPNNANAISIHKLSS